MEVIDLSNNSLKMYFKSNLAKISTFSQVDLYKILKNDKQPKILQIKEDFLPDQINPKSNKNQILKFLIKYNNRFM